MKTTLATALRLLALAMMLVAVLAVPTPKAHAFAGPYVAAFAAATVAAKEAAPAPASAPANRTADEIARLLDRLRASPCRFQRNGRWYDGRRAADHLQRKLDYAIGRDMTVDSSEAFIDQAATRSSFTGRPYRVQCGEAAAVPARDWFLGVLVELRAPAP